MDHGLELISPILEILEIEVSNILYNPGHIGNLAFISSTILEILKIEVPIISRILEFQMLEIAFLIFLFGPGNAAGGWLDPEAHMLPIFKLRYGPYGQYIIHIPNIVWTIWSIFSGISTLNERINSFTVTLSEIVEVRD